MNSIKFPDMLNISSTNVVEDKEASTQDLYLLLSSEKGELFGDPFYGIRLKRYLFDQNNYILRDILIDEIFSQIKLFCPQLTVLRKDIKIIQDKNTLKAQIQAINNLDYTTDMYDLVLFQDEERK